MPERSVTDKRRSEQMRSGSAIAAFAALLLVSIYAVPAQSHLRAPASVAREIWGLIQPRAGVSIEMRGRVSSNDFAGIMAWLSSRRPLFASAEARYGVDRRAIAGMIAAEALTDVRPYWFLMRRSSGPGKVHYKEFWTSEGDPVAKEAERLGLLPKRSMEQRREILATDEGAVQYVAAILDGFVIVSRDPKLRCDLGALGTLYSGWDYRDVRSGEFVLPTKDWQFNTIGHWVKAHEAELASAVGPPRIKC